MTKLAELAGKQAEQMRLAEEQAQAERLAKLEAAQDLDISLYYNNRTL